MPTAYKGPDDISRPAILGNVIREIKVERRSKGMLIIFSVEPNVSNCPTLFVSSQSRVHADRPGADFAHATKRDFRNYSAYVMDKTS